MTSKTVSHLNDAVQHFQSVLDQCPVSHPDHAAALTNLAYARLKGYIRNDLEDIDATTSLFREALALRPQPHPDHPLSLHNLAVALTWRHNKKSTAADIREAAKLYHELLPLCPEGTYLRSIAAGANGVDYVINGCNKLPKDASDEGIHLRRVVLELCPLGHQRRPRTLYALLQSLYTRFTQCGSIDDLDESIKLSREAVSLLSDGHPERDSYLNELALSLQYRFDHQGKPNDLDEAISLYEEALRLRPVGHKTRDSSLGNLGLALIARFNKRGNIDDMTQAISLYREALTLRPPGHPGRDTTLNNLALALQNRYRKLHVIEDLNEAIDRYRESLRLRRHDHPERHLILSNLSASLCSRFMQTRENEDIEEAINLCRESLAALSSLHPDRPSHVSPTLSIEIRASYEAGRMLGSGELIGKLQTSWDDLLDHGDDPFVLSFPPVCDVHPSLTLKAAIVHACDDQDVVLSDFLVDCEIARDTDAGHAQLAAYMTSKMVSHLNIAVQHFQSVLDQCPVSHPDHAAALTNLAYARLKGYIRNNLQDIDITTSLFRDALALRPQPHADHPLSLHNLAVALSWRHNKKSTAADIREAAKLYHELLPLCPEGTYLRSIAAGAYGVDYVIDRCNNLPADASDEGIHLRRVVLKLCPLGHQRRPDALYPLLQSLCTRFTQCGSIDDLDESIKLGREAVSLLSDGHPERDSYLSHLALSLEYRFKHQGKPNDLDEAISLYEEALRLCPVGHKHRDSYLDNLGRALIARFNKRDDIDDMTRAISLLREALTLRPPGHPRRDTTLNNLALALHTRYNEWHVIEDINEAIDRYRESLRLTRHDHPERDATLSNLSASLCSRFMQTRENEDIEEAINLCRESLAALSSLHPSRYFSYIWLQEAYLSRYRILHDPADLSLAVENFRLASGHPTQGLPSRIESALRWVAEAERRQHDSSLEAYQMCFELFDSHVMTRLSIISRREAATAFRGAQSLPVDAASCAIRRDNLRRAVEFVEQGRGQQWSLASRLRTPLEDLKSASPQLAQKLLGINKRLSHAQGSVGSADPATADRAATKYRRLTKQWEAAVAEIRNLQGFS
ncbi:hypothetical protein BDR03DRAFT_1094421, partial [Suillus americanus]